MKERQEQLGEVVGGGVVGIVGARYHGQLPEGEQRVAAGPGHGHDGLPAAPGDQHRHADQGELVLDRVVRGMGQVSATRWTGWWPASLAASGIK